MAGESARRTGCQIVGHMDLITKFNKGDRLFDTEHPRYRNAARERNLPICITSDTHSAESCTPLPRLWNWPGPAAFGNKWY